MEAIRKHGLYIPEWKLNIEFPGTQEQYFWDEERLLQLIRVVIDRCPWEDGLGNSLNEALEISLPELAPAGHPDYGPETTVTFKHKDLLLKPKQLWTYERWARRVSHQLEKKIRTVMNELNMSSNIVWKASARFSSLDF